MVQVTDDDRILDNRDGFLSRSGVAAALGAALLLAAAGEASAADSLSISASPDARATVPMTIGASGSASEASTLRVFVQQGGGGCSGGEGGAGANAARQSARSGSTEVISRQPNGAFAYSAQYTPPVAGAYSICAYLFRTTATSSVSSQVSQVFSAAEAPPAAPGSSPAPGSSSSGTGAQGTPSTSATAPGSTSATGKPKRCVVPKLKGRTYATARRRIHKAGCIVGEVVKPDKRLARPLRPGGRTRILKVVYQRPKAGTVLKARGRVTLQLRYFTPKTPKRR